MARSPGRLHRYIRLVEQWPAASCGDSMKVTIVALGRYSDIFDYFRRRIDERFDSNIRKILVRDDTDIQSADGWEIIQGPDNFSMSVNHNTGWHAVEPDSDILNLNDDVYFLEPD